MASTAIIHKKSAISGNTPSTTQLEYGEIAINTVDGKLFFKFNDGVEDIISTIVEVTEDNLAVDSSGLSNSSSSTLSGVLSDLDSAISNLSFDSSSILGSGTIQDPYRVTIDSVLAGGNVTTKDLTVNNLTVNGTINGVEFTAASLDGATLDDIIAFSIALG